MNAIRSPLVSLWLALSFLLKGVTADALAGPNLATVQAQPPRKGDCHWVHGRFIVYTGDGRFVIWITGTKRTVEIGDDKNDASGIVQTYVKRVPLTGDIDPLLADFRICALVDSKRGHMQLVRVTDVRGATLSGKSFESDEKSRPPKP